MLILIYTMEFVQFEFLIQTLELFIFINVLKKSQLI